MNSKTIATMKNLFTRLMLVAVAAMGFVACQDGFEDVTITPEAKEIVMTFVAEAPDTRTSVAIDGDVAKYSWSEGDKVGFYYVATDVDYKKKGNSNVAVIADDGTATFTASFVETDDATSYNIGAFYPGNSWMSHASENPFNNVKVKISNEQILTDGSFDPAADLMMSKPFMDVALDVDAVKTLEFTRIAAIGKMNLKLTDMVEGEVIESVKFTLAEGIHFNGPVVLDLENSTYELGTTGTSNYVNLTGSLAANADDRTAIFFTCFPGEYSGAYTIEVETDKATYSKTGELTKALTFTAGDVLNFNATVGDRAEVEEPGELTTYELLKDVSNLSAGDKIIIAASDYDYALSTTQNDNNRGQASITKSEDGTISYGADVQILTVEAGTKTGTFAFNTGSGYLYAASSSSNYLRTETTLSDNSSWTITIDATGVATIIAQGTNTRNYMQYNTTSSLFACYAKNNSMKPVAIYYLDGVESDYLTVSTDTISFTAEGGDETFTVSKNFEAEVSVTCDNSLFTITPGENGSYTVTAPKNETTEEITGTITVTAGEFTKTIAVTQETVPVEAEAITIAEFIEKADTTTEYKLTGTISNVVNTTYGNFDLTDASGKIYVYGLYSPEGDSKYWSTAGVKAGDVITIQGTYELYENTTNEVVNAKYVSHYGVTVDKTSVSLAAEGSSESVTLTLINTTEAISVEHNDKFTVTLNSNTLTISADANNTGATISDTITVKVGDAYTEFAVSQAAKPTGEEVNTYTETFENWVSTLSDNTTSYNKSGTFDGVSESGITWTYASCGNPNQTNTDVTALKGVGLNYDYGVTIGKNGNLSATLPGGVTSISFYALTSSKGSCTVTITSTSGTTLKTTTISTSTKGLVEITDIDSNGEDITISFTQNAQNRTTVAGLVYTK